MGLLSNNLIDLIYLFFIWDTHLFIVNKYKYYFSAIQTFQTDFYKDIY